VNKQDVLRERKLRQSRWRRAVAPPVEWEYIVSRYQWPYLVC